MSERYITGERLFRAVWTRHGLRIDEGTVLLDNEVQFIVSCAGFTTESVSQADKGGWYPTRAKALEHQLCRLGMSLRFAEGDAMRIKARIQSTKIMLANVDQLETRGEA